MKAHRAVTVAQAASEDRWRKWQARGDENDRRTAVRMRLLVAVIAAALAVAITGALVW